MMNQHAVIMSLVLLGGLGGCPYDVAAQPVLGIASYYELVLLEGTVSWHDARLLAMSRTHLGQHGYLATLRSQRESRFVENHFVRDEPSRLAWIGGYEPVDNEVWLWADGPDAGDQMSLGEHEVGPVPYVNWGGAEPTNSGGVNHDFAAVNLGQPIGGVGTGEWIAVANIPSTSTPVRAMIVEYPLPVTLPEPSSALLLVIAAALRPLRRPATR